MDILTKIEALKQKMTEKGSILVAFSGGVDSSVVAKLAVEALGDDALAVIVDSETYPRSELLHAEQIAEELGIKYKLVKFTELADPEFVQNPPNRCYLCRQEFAKALTKLAAENNIQTIADGVITSDFNEHRPGIKAADEAGFWHPLVEMSVDKPQVREIAKVLGLKVHEKPSAACLSSRIPYGEPITVEKLSRIEQAEEFIKGLGFTQVRVRNYNDTLARIEVVPAELERLLDDSTQAKVITKLKELGFIYVTIDLEGYRSGSMDEVL
ncbi:MAG: ATP-dependent sacrificial sulfur transferase LarE [Thermoplasmata archaeon]|nr:ATP-dependent sacrificial sulfur transferase LarE [Thermoplasmata archaeon]